jgi:glycosyltransferase involved in cell wall biosynthesis
MEVGRGFDAGVTKPLHLAYFSPESYGGLADYAREQANALSAMDARISFITTPSVAKARGKVNYEVLPLLAEPPAARAGRNRLVRRLSTAGWIMGNMARLAAWIRREGVRYVLLGSYMEYFAPIWAPPLRSLARSGVKFGAMVHDPVRETVIGPRWWHRWSVASNYSFLLEAFVHDPIELNTVRPVAGLRTTVVPHGPYQFAPASLPREAIREQLRIPPDALLMLAFGHIRDAKNLDLILRAMSANPKYHLLVSGKELSASQRPASFYQKLASTLGVADRCRWRIGFVPEAEIGNLFEASDLVLLNYNGNFRSASGVLNVAVQYRKPCLASGGPGNLRTSMERYALGQCVVPDDEAALARALARWDSSSLKPDWTGYDRDNSWERNAALVIERMASRSALQPS